MKIDYETYTLAFIINETEYVLPIRTNINKFTILPRREMIQAISIQLKEDSVVYAKQIDKSVFISNNNSEIWNKTNNKQSILEF